MVQQAIEVIVSIAVVPDTKAIVLVGVAGIVLMITNTGEVVPEEVVG